MGKEVGVLLAQGLDVTNFLKDIPRVPKSILEQGSTFNYFLKIPKGINGTWVIRQGSSQLKNWMYQYLFKNVPNFVRDVPNVPKSIPRWGMTFNHFLRVSKEINRPWKWRQVSYQLKDWMYQIILRMYLVQSSFQNRKRPPITSQRFLNE